jgi:hypothetical protein
MIAASSLVLYFGSSNLFVAANARREVCDLDAGYFLGAEDEVIRCHSETLLERPELAKERPELAKIK